MASNGFAKVLKRNSWRLTTILVYAVLEWTLILLLLINALFQYITTKFASFFGLQPPCLWCSRLDHILEPKEPDFYRKLICDRHAQEISLLGYCRNHRKLADAHGMCEDCAFSMPTNCSAENNESKPRWITCMSMVADMGFDLSKKTVAKGLLTNGHDDEFKPRGAEPDEKPMNGWVSEELCTCCNAPLVHKLYSHNIIKTILFDGNEESILKSQWNALDYAGNGLERALEGEDGLKKQSSCVCGGTQVKISEVFVNSPNESNSVSSSSSSSSSVALLSDDETDTREEKVDSNSIDLEENTKDVSETHCSEEPEEVQIEPRSLEVFQDDVDSAVTQPDIFVDKRIAYPEIATQECAMEPDLTVTEMAIDDTANDQVTKRLAFVEEPLESNSEGAREDVEGLIQASADVGNHNEESIEDVAIRNEAFIEDGGDQNEVAAADSTCNSLQSEEIAPEVVTKGSDDGDVSDPQMTCSVDILPRSFEVSSDAEDIPEEVELAEERDCVAVTEQGGNATEITSEDFTELLLEDTIAVSEPTPVNRDDQTASLNSERGTDETLDLEDPEIDGINGSEADPPSPELVTEQPTTSNEIGNEETTSTDVVVTEDATSTDVATEEETSTNVATQEATPNLVVTEEATMEISEGADVDSKKEKIDEVSEDIDVTTREDNGAAAGDLNGKPVQNLDRNSAEAGHQEHNEADKMDEDRASETPRSIEGLQFLHKRMLIDRKESSPDSLDGSIISEIDGEFEADRLKRALEAERKALNTLYSELEEERNAAAVAANQTMAMITRLQEEKAAVQMEAVQYQRMMEEQSEYDQEALQLLNEILVKREKEKQELEKELELCRRRLLHYEAKERRMEKKMKTYESERPSSAEKGEETPDNQSCRNRTSSSSSLSDNSDDISSDPNDVNDRLEAGESNQYTPSDMIMSVGRGYVDAEQRTSLDESLVDFEEERISILEQLKVLEEKLHTFANDDQAGMAHPEANGMDLEDNMEGTDEDKETVETMNGNGTPTARRVGGGKGKRLLPLFEATNVEEDPLYHAEELSLADRSNDWHNVSMVVTDNNRLVIEEEVYNLYERLQALEADREFLKHTIKSLRKGDEGMKLLQEIVQHLRDLRKVELKARNFSDLM